MILGALRTTMRMRASARGMAALCVRTNGAMPVSRPAVRLLRTSAPRFASEDPRSSWEQTLPPGFEKLGESPEALAAVNHLIEVLEKHGLDLSSGAKPSMMQMAKLATNAEVRECTAKGMRHHSHSRPRNEEGGRRSVARKPAADHERLVQVDHRRVECPPLIGRRI